MNNTIMQIKQQDCTGCKACGIICPVAAITFERDREGFEYPAIDTTKCMQCGKCLATCPATKNFDKKETALQQKLYIARNRNKHILKSSSSGGIFTALANNVISGGGYVYGVCFDEKFRVVYKRGKTLEDIHSMRGSKYVDAYISMKLIKDFIEDIKLNREVLFSGTPCQVYGMKEMCKQMGLSAEHVIWVDFFVCSGKVSSYLWNKEKQEYANQGHLEEVSFRSKTRGWKNFGMYRKIDGISYNDDFLVHRWSKFLDNSVSRRRTCKACAYRRGVESDISLGDMWYPIAIPKEWKDNQGISIVEINSSKGLNKFRLIMNQLEVQEVTEPIKRATTREMYNSEDEEQKRKAFWDIYYNEGWGALCATYAQITWKEKLLFGVVRPILIKTGLLDFIKSRGRWRGKKKARRI